MEKKLREVEELTAGNTKATLIIALSYGGRTEIANAAKSLAEAVAAGKIKPSDIDEKAVSGAMYLPDVPTTLLYAQAGAETEQLLTWQSVIANFTLQKHYGRIFGESDLEEAIEEFNKKRWFGYFWQMICLNSTNTIQPEMSV